MHVLTRRTTASAADDIAFLRDRCSELQHALDQGVLPTAPLHDDVLRRWTRLLLPQTPRREDQQEALEALYVLQARIEERVTRGGVADICADVECLVRAILVDSLQRATDRAVALLA